MTQRLTATLLAANLLYLFILPSAAGKIISGFGCLLILTLVVAQVLSRTLAARLHAEFRGTDRSDSFAVAAFALPLLSTIVQPTVGFWHVDGRALLIVAWLVVVSWLIGAVRSTGNQATAGQSDTSRVPVLTWLFVIWSSLFWLMIVWDVGVGRAVLDLAGEDRLTITFELWETQRAKDHLFLAWLSRESFADGIAYTNHLHPFMLFLYGCSKLMSSATGLPLYVGRNLTPFAMAAVGVIAFAALLPRVSNSSPQGAKYHATLFLVLGFFLSEWHYWVYFYRYQFDSVFPLIAYLGALVWASASSGISERNAVGVALSLMLFAAFGWIYTPLVILALWCLFGRVEPSLGETLASNRGLVRASAAAIVIGIVAYGLPLLLVAMRGYGNVASSYLSRSGLDGDTRYFQHVVQAVFNPFAPARPWWSLVFPASVPLAIAAAGVWLEGRTLLRQMARQLTFLVAPYFFSLAIFPQAVSIHPYLYDHLLLLPVVLTGATWALASPVQRRLAGGALLAVLILMITLLMGNLLAITQELHQLPRD